MKKEGVTWSMVIFYYHAYHPRGLASSLPVMQIGWEGKMN
jgi:hypothetical protein